jgi:hypothetical protein
MTPKEISELKKQSWRVKVAIESKDLRVLRFLRNHVTACYSWHSPPCGRCGELVCPTFASPYNAPNPGWCGNCVIIAFNTSDMPRLPNAEYNWVEHFFDSIPDDYDGPPIAIG